MVKGREYGVIGIELVDVMVDWRLSDLENECSSPFSCRPSLSLSSATATPL